MGTASGVTPGRIDPVTASPGWKKEGDRDWQEKPVSPRSGILANTRPSLKHGAAWKAN